MTNRPRVDILNVNFFDWDGEEVVVGGAERYVLELARLIGSLGAQPRIVQNAGRYFSKVYADVPVFGVPAGVSMDLFAMSAGFREAVSDAALVIASPLELASHLAIDAPVIGISHGIHWDYPNNRMDVHDPAVERRIVDAVLSCSACVAVDTNFYNWIRCFDADAAARIRYIPNFVDLEAFRASPKRFDGPRLELLFPRRLCRERGFHELVEAFDALLPRHPSLDLRLCGSGPPEDEAIARAFIERHPHRVRWSQLSMDEMPAAYASSHIVLVPTVSAEGTSLSCIEAMATNNAIVTTAVGGLPNLVIDGYNGMIAGAGAKGLVEAIERLVGDRALVGRLAKNALSVVPAFARDRWLARWTPLLMEYLTSHRTDPAITTVAAASVDPYRHVAWPFGFEGEVDAARAAQAFAEQELVWRNSELSGIKNSTGWALLQQLYRIRFALFPKGSSREAAGRWLMRRGRSLWRRLREKPVFPQSAASSPEISKPASTPPRGLGTATRYGIVCLPILEWGFRIQRPQQLARQFVRRGHEVVFARHTFGSALDARVVEHGVEEIELPGVPGTNPYRDRLNDADAQGMADALLAHLARRGTGRFVCFVQLPFWSPVAERLRAASGCDLVYDCMDLHSGFSSNADAALADEQRLLELSDLVVCSSQRLLEHAAPHAKRTALVRNGVDYEAFARVSEPAAASSESLTIGYYGAIADWFDSGLVAAIARLRPSWRIVLIGSTWSADIAPLEALPNVTLTGEKPYAELPSLIGGWHCCIIPFRHTPLTDATNPVKVYEMLAAAKPIVSVRLPELVPMSEAGLLALADGGEAFVAAIEAEVAADNDERRTARRDFASANTWEARVEAIGVAIESLQPEVSIIVVTYNNRDLNKLCLDSLLRDSDYANFEVIVVDNASKDATPNLLREYAKREPRLRIVLNEANLGFAAASNQGAALAGGRYFCFLNNDTVVHGAWLQTLIGHLRRHAHLGLVGPVTNAIGNEAQIPVSYEDLVAMPAWADAHCATHRGRLTEVSMLAFFCVAMSRWVWRTVGPLDERFGTGMFEDDDYNRRVRAAGFEIGLAWDSFVHHWQMASFKLLGDDEYLRIYRENRSRYATKWSGSTPSQDPLAALKRSAAAARGTVIFAPSVGWAIPLAQRPHHLARVLAQDGYVVVFDCTNAADDVDTLREVEPRLFLYKGPSSALAGLPNVTLWTFSYNYDYRDGFPAGTAVVYDWIDDLTVFPYDQRKLATLHGRALRDANVVVSVARQLHDQAVRERPDALYVPNAVEEGRFDREPDPNPALADTAFASVLAAGRPVAGYYGALARWFDYALVDATARLRPDWSFVLIGPDHDGSLARSKLDRLPNVYALGTRAYAALPGFLHRFDVATIPFAINDITLATSPLKLFEYFAAGRPVVSTPMPECAAFEVVRIVHGAEAFSEALDAARSDAADPAFRARLAALAAQNTWRMRARETMQALDASRRKDVSGATIAKADGDPVAPPALAHKPFLRGRCNVCGQATRFFRDDPSLDRESLTCEHCRTTSRYRSIARGVLKAVEQRTGLRADALSGLPAEAERAAFRVYDTQAPFFHEPCAYPLPDLLRRCRWTDVTVSSYRPDVAPGEPLAAGVVNQNLERLTFADASFDLVVTSDVMEHVRLDRRAHVEIARVLKPGGIYVFTVPHFRDRKDTLVRVAVRDPDDPSRDEHLTVPEYHGDANAPGGNGALSYRSYGTILDEELDSLGFDVHYSFEDDDAHGIRNTELFYCVKR